VRSAGITDLRYDNNTFLYESLDCSSVADCLARSICKQLQALARSAPSSTIMIAR
jgi:hypothetical protein